MRKALGLAPGRSGRPGYADDLEFYAASTVQRMRAEGEKEAVAVDEAARLILREFGVRVSARKIRAAVAKRRLKPKTLREQGNEPPAPLADFSDPA
jgi:transposase